MSNNNEPVVGWATTWKSNERMIPLEELDKHVDFVEGNVQQTPGGLEFEGVKVREKKTPSWLACLFGAGK